MTLPDPIESLLNSISLITISLWIVLATAIIYMLLHRQRHNKIFAQLSIIFSFFPVLIHEIGHAVMTSITRGYVDDIYMVLTPARQIKEGRQGYTETSSQNRLARILITFSGYAFPPLIFLVGVFLAAHDYSIIFLFILMIFFFYYLWHTSQKWLPITILILLIFSISNMIITFSDWMTHVVNIGYNMILGVLLGEMIQSIIITARVNFSNNIEWDGRAMRRLTYLPATLWWFIWSVISIWSIYQAWNLITSIA